MVTLDTRSALQEHDPKLAQQKARRVAGRLSVAAFPIVRTAVRRITSTSDDTGMHQRYSPM